MTGSQSPAQLCGSAAAALALAGACACAWKRSGSSSRSEDPVVAWRQLPPSDPDALEIKAFGETHLQARLVCNRLPARAMQQRADSFFELMNMRRTMRFYSSDDVPQKALDACIATAGTSPSGAHHQPWYFAVVKTDALKLRIRELVEAEEKVNYERRMRKSWIEDLSSMTGAKADERLRCSQTGAPQKPYLTEAPALIAMFKQTHTFDQEGQKIDNYYVNESCGIAAGFLIAALHNVGLATLTSTPMGAEQAIRELLGRPDNEKLFLLMPIGYPAKDATVPYRVPLRKAQSELSAVF